MNRVSGDYFETLLYKIFVSIDENTTVAEVSFSRTYIRVAYTFVQNFSIIKIRPKAGFYLQI